MAERDELLEQVVGAWRDVDRDGRIQALPAWHDLDPADRRHAHEAAEELRRIESGLHTEGLSTTAQAVLARIHRTGGPR